MNSGQTPVKEGLRMWVIYERPSDFPNNFVVREWWLLGKEIVVDTRYQLALTIQEARALVPEGLTNIGRRTGDDPVIAEVWI